MLENARGGKREYFPYKIESIRINETWAKIHCKFMKEIYIAKFRVMLMEHRLLLCNVDMIVTLHVFMFYEEAQF